MLPQPPLWLVIVAFVCALGPLVFFHELGHYLVARVFRIPAEVFSIGFGHELVGWTDKQGTRWKVAWLPLGGYVKFLGDMGPAGNPAELEDIPEHLRDRTFQVRPVWQRFLVVLAGPMANFLLAIIIFAAFFAIPRLIAGIGQGSVLATPLQLDRPEYRGCRGRTAPRRQDRCSCWPANADVRRYPLRRHVEAERNGSR